MTDFPSPPTALGVREPGGTWVPNELIDFHLPVLGPNAVVLYLVLARCETSRDYPSLYELATLLGWSSDKVRNLLKMLHGRGLLNDHDLDRIRHSRPELSTG